MSLRTVHGVVAWAVVAAIVVQVFLAGLSVAQLGGTGSFMTHVEVGRVFGIVFLALVITAALARTGRRSILTALGLLGLFIVQSILPYLDDAGLDVLAALHPVNALVMVVLAVWYARSAWSERAQATA
jgi:hypothetical protein